MKNWKKRCINRINICHKNVMAFGKWTGCHQMPERSFFIGAYQFPICARCTGLLVGYIIAIILLIFDSYISITSCVYAILIMFIDWYVQYLGIKPSTNLRRLITGIICGIGYLQFWVIVVRSFNKFV